MRCLLNTARPEAIARSVGHCLSVQASTPKGRLWFQWCYSRGVDGLMDRQDS
jgi:hypothetical protein